MLYLLLSSFGSHWKLFSVESYCYICSLTDYKMQMLPVKHNHNRLHPVERALKTNDIQQLQQLYFCMLFVWLYSYEIFNSFGLQFFYDTILLFSTHYHDEGTCSINFWETHTEIVHVENLCFRKVVLKVPVLKQISNVLFVHEYENH